ncbi:tail fiber domain-containing protein [Caulobacter sp. UC70_42]|uniref:tail fiber domain-containing protein n=1 Tax=Caulobacter sp. UC70_42 TaxID=3374551 RepID=UPI003756B80B
MALSSTRPTRARLAGTPEYTNLSPGQQQLYDQSNTAQNAALGIANQQIGRVGQALGQTLTTDGLPALSGGFQVQQAQGGPIQSSFDMGQALKYGYDAGGDIQKSVGGNLDTARQQAIDATYNQAMSRLNPQFERQDNGLETRLANQGLGINSAAYQNARDQLGRQQTDATNQAVYSSIGAGEDAANALFGRQLNQGQFANSAQSQANTQNLQAAGFHNTTAGQDYSQNLGAAQFANSAQNQGFQQSLANAQIANQGAQANAQFGNEARNQGLQERAYIQNQPLNQFNSLMSSGQVSTPQGVQYTPTQVGQTDVLGAYALNQQAQQANANRAAQANSGMMGGLFSLGSAALMSDVRLKKNIERVGTLKPGIDLYAYEYAWGGGSRVGVLAQEVLAVNPAAIVNVGGYMAVDYAVL